MKPYEKSEYFNQFIKKLKCIANNTTNDKNNLSN